MFTIAAAVKQSAALWITAGLVLAAALALAIAYLIKIRQRSIQVPLWTVIVSGLVLACSISFALWTGLGGDRDGRVQAGPSPSMTTEPGRTTTPPAPPGPTPTTTPASGPCAMLQTAATIEPGPDAGISGAKLAEASYTLTPNPQILIQYAGRVQGSGPAPGQALYLTGTADDQTVDSTPEHNRGSDYYFLIAQLEPDHSGCWSIPRRPASYECSGGITFIYDLVSMDATLGQRLLDQQRTNQKIHDDGYPPQQFKAQPLKMLQEFRVDTTSAACQ